MPFPFVDIGHCPLASSLDLHSVVAVLADGADSGFACPTALVDFLSLPLGLVVVKVVVVLVAEVETDCNFESSLVPVPASAVGLVVLVASLLLACLLVRLRCFVVSGIVGNFDIPPP